MVDETDMQTLIDDLVASKLIDEPLNAANFISCDEMEPIESEQWEELLVAKSLNKNFLPESITISDSDNDDYNDDDGDSNAIEKEPEASQQQVADALRLLKQFATSKCVSLLRIITEDENIVV